MCDDGHQVVDVVDVVAVAVVKKFPKTKRRNVNKYETAIYSRCHSRVMNMNTNSVFLFYISLTHFASCVYFMNDCGRRLTRVTQIMHELRLRLHDTHTHTHSHHTRVDLVKLRNTQQFRIYCAFVIIFFHSSNAYVNTIPTTIYCYYPYYYFHNKKRVKKKGKSE